MNIENYREQPPGGALIALFDVYLPEWKLTFRNLKLLQSKQGGKYLGFPSFKEDEMPGYKIKYTPFFEFSKERGEEFKKKVLEELKEFMR